METLEQHETQVENMRDEFFDDLARLEERFPHTELTRAAGIAFDALAQNIEGMRERCFRDYKLTAVKGLSFKNREALVDWKKVRWCDEELAALRAMKKWDVRPFSQWLQPEDYRWIKSAGLTKFLQFNIQRVVAPKVEKEELGRGRNEYSQKYAATVSKIIDEVFA